MSDYRRLVAYIYLYNQGKRVKNVGFTKVESRNGECRIQIQIKGAWVAEGNACKFYIFYRKDGKMRGILLGETAIRSGSCADEAGDRDGKHHAVRPGFGTNGRAHHPVGEGSPVCDPVG